jgi:hypothetical protein
LNPSPRTDVVLFATDWQCLEAVLKSVPGKGERGEVSELG